MARRNKIGKSYVERRADGTFKDWSSIGRSLRQDRVKRAVRKVKSGYGHQGDQAVVKSVKKMLKS